MEYISSYLFISPWVICILKTVTACCILALAASSLEHFLYISLSLQIFKAALFSFSTLLTSTFDLHFPHYIHLNETNVTIDLARPPTSTAVNLQTCNHTQATSLTIFFKFSSLHSLELLEVPQPRACSLEHLNTQPSFTSEIRDWSSANVKVKSHLASYFFTSAMRPTEPLLTSLLAQLLRYFFAQTVETSIRSPIICHHTTQREQATDEYYSRSSHTSTASLQAFSLLYKVRRLHPVYVITALSLARCTSHLAPHTTTSFTTC